MVWIIWISSAAILANLCSALISLPEKKKEKKKPIY